MATAHAQEAAMPAFEELGKLVTVEGLVGLVRPPHDGRRNPSHREQRRPHLRIREQTQETDDGDQEKCEEPTTQATAERRWRDLLSKQSLLLTLCGRGCATESQVAANLRDAHGIARS